MSTPSAAMTLFSPQGIAEARLLAQRSGRSVVDVLETNSELDIAQFIAELARAARLQAMDMAALHALSPAFDIMSFTLATRHECLPLRAPGKRLRLVVADPFHIEF